MNDTSRINAPFNPFLIDTYFDGYGYCAFLGGAFIGRYETKDKAFAAAYAAKCNAKC